MGKRLVRWGALTACCLVLALSLGGTAWAAQWSVSKNGNVLEIAYGSGRDYPQYAALHLDSGYFRLIPSSASGWGTSAVLLPSLWEGSGSGQTYHQGAAVECSWASEGDDLALSLRGSIAGLSVSGRVVISPPTEGTLSAQVSMNCSGSVNLATRSCEAFKPVMLSSMHISETKWDASEAFVGDQAFALPKSGFVITPCAVSGNRWGLTGGDSAWKNKAPTIEVVMDRELPVTGWVTSSGDPNDDNVGFWAASDSVLSSWSYTLKAKP